MLDKCYGKKRTTLTMTVGLEMPYLQLWWETEWNFWGKSWKILCLLIHVYLLYAHTELQQILLVKTIWSMGAFMWTEHIQVLHLLWDMILLCMKIFYFLTRHTVGSEIKLSLSDEKDHLWVKWIYHHVWSSFKMQSECSFNLSLG